MKRILLLFLLFIPTNTFAFSPNSTHAGLTQEVIDFYNQSFEAKISNSDKELIIQGAIDEDDPVQRVLNHFYDPVRNIGLDNATLSTAWASGDIAENIYSWKKGVEAYSKGDTKTAFLILGHILHLIEDAGVPEHTRNDRHPPGDESPLEAWAALNKNRNTLTSLGEQYFLSGVEPIEKNNLNDYFDFIANYSNNNFFSKDTIDSFQYDNPQANEFDESYAYGTDFLTKERVKLSIATKLKDGSISKILTKDNNYSVLEEYFDRLAKQIIPTGAGVVDLFITEGEKAKEKYDNEKMEVANEKVSFIAKFTTMYVKEVESWKIVKVFGEVKESFTALVPKTTISNVSNISSTIVKEEAKNTTKFVQNDLNKYRSSVTVGPILAFNNVPVKNSPPSINQNIKEVVLPTPTQNVSPIYSLPFPVGVPGFAGGGPPPQAKPPVPLLQVENTEEVEEETPTDEEEEIPIFEEEDGEAETPPVEEATSTPPIVEEIASSTSPIVEDIATSTLPTLEEIATTTATSTPPEEGSEQSDPNMPSLTISVPVCDEQIAIRGCQVRSRNVRVLWHTKIPVHFYILRIDDTEFRTDATETVITQKGVHGITVNAFTTNGDVLTADFLLSLI